ncbi:MAG TPA: 2-isopropylmalate synthase [Gaiellales bacterium]|jgi:2-isopropylmalate synthase|nr:2-isopropylmalate synthase [Gaiellales bacterium]
MAAPHDNIVRIFDTTLRDGEQSPGIALNAHEKIEIARQLERLGVDIIEAGFAISSQGELEGVRAVSQAVDCVVASLSRTGEEDVDAAIESLSDARNPRIHVFIATSDIHLEHKLRMTRAQVLEGTRFAVARAKAFCSDVEFSCEDATRSDLDFMARVVRTAIAAGATTINIPDTVGYTVPAEYVAILRGLYERVPELEGIVLSVHCHDDLGMAVANSIAGVEAGARQVECTINGIGERAGNASLEEIVMLLATRRPHYDMETNIVTQEIVRSSRLVSRLTGYPVQPNKAIVGRNAFAHEAGIHQHGVLAHRRTYEIMDAESVGLHGSDIVLGKHSGRHALGKALADLGFTIEGDDLKRAFVRFKEMADRKGKITSLDLEAIASDSLREREEAYRLASVAISTRTGEQAQAEVTVAGDGGEQTATAHGDGPVDAVFGAINRVLGVPVTLVEYSIGAVTGGADALGEVRVVVESAGRTFSSQAVSTDITEASAEAYLRACAHAKAATEPEQELIGV